MQPPFVIQSLIESQLTNSFNKLPTTLSSKCHFSFKKYFCGSYLLQPQTQVISDIFTNYGILPTYAPLLTSYGVNLTGLANNEFYLPSYPSYQVCMDYAKNCKVFIEISNEIQLQAYCNLTVNGIRSYPSTSQVISSLPLALGPSTIQIDFTTNPNPMLSASDGNYIPTTDAIAPKNMIAYAVTSKTYNYATCQKFQFQSNQQYLTSTCANAVDYSFYLPANYSLEYFELQAKQNLNNSALSILPIKCQKAVKNLVCSSIYMKCEPNGPTGNIYNEVDASFVQLPFQRPCKKVCDSIDTDCYGILNLMGLAQDCSATFDYTFGTITAVKPKQFDSTNNVTVCNAMDAIYDIASTSEPYIGTACTGILTEVYVPPGNQVSSTLVPMQSSYAIQSLIESQLSSSFKQLPVWLAPKCHLSFRKYFCGSYLLKPQIIKMSEIFVNAGIIPNYASLLVSMGVNVTGLANYEFSLPSYPSYQVCLEYASHCNSFITNSGQAALVAYCNKTSNGIKSYPSTTQIINSISLTVGSATIPLTFTTDPNTMTTANDNNYESSCPEGFVIPDDPNDSRVNYIDGSNCALPCRYLYKLCFLCWFD